MTIQTTFNLSRYEKQGLDILKEKRQVSQSELLREAIRLLMRQENIEIKTV